MGANNWTRCPGCAAEHAKELGVLSDKIRDAYGKVPIAEFDALRADFEARAAAPVEREFGEYYEIGVDSDGEFMVRYNGACRNCGLTYEFSHDATVPLE